MIFSRCLPIVLPIIIAAAPAQMAFAQYQALDAGDEIATTSGPFAWAVRIEAGEATLTGAVPYASVATVLARRAGIEGGEDAMTVADGAPLGFLSDAMTAIDASALLEDGSITYEGGQWTVAGRLAADQSLETLTGLLGESTGAGTGWTIDVDTAADAVSSRTPEPVAQDVMDSVEQLLEQSAGEPEALTENIDPDAMDAETDVPPEGESVGADGDEADSSLESEAEAAVDMGGQPDAAAGEEADAADEAAATETGSTAEESVAEPAGEASVTASGGVPITEELAPSPPAANNMTTADLEAEALQCRERMTALTQDNAILFASGSTSPTAASQELISDIADILAICPSQPVYVEGHTDADGRAETNLVLSLTRAEAVVDLLVEQGIDPERLFAVGYGASLPIASNETAAGKAENRRIVFSFEDIAQ